MKHYLFIILKKIRSIYSYYIFPKEVYLTFDDGPCGGSKFVIDFFIDNKIPATFFWTGIHFHEFKHLNFLKKKIIDSNLFTLANHGYSHAFNQDYERFYSSISNLKEDFDKNTHFLNLNNKYCRPAGINIWRKSTLRKKIEHQWDNNCYKLIGWDLTVDFLKYDSEKIFKMIKNKTKYGHTFKQNKIVLLFHDWEFSNNLQSQMQLEFLLTKIQKSYHFRFKNLIYF